jgi:tight adherence protein C
MSNELLILGALFAGATVLTFVGVQGLNLYRQRKARRAAGEDADDMPELVLGGLTPILAEQTPITKSGKEELEQELRAAGFYRPTALMEYRAVRAVLTLLPLFGGGALALLVPPASMPMIAVGAIIAAALGFSLPRLYINARGRRRAREIERGLPVAVDLISLGLSGGQNILSAFKRVSREMRFSYPVMSQELAIVSRHSDLRSLQHALEQLADRVRIQEVRTLALILVQSERLGTDIATALLEFSANFRTTMKQRAEAQANRASFWMVFPTIFCLWMAAAVLVAGPVFYEFWHRRDLAREAMSDRLTPEKATSKGRNMGPQPQQPGQPEPSGPLTP